MKEFLSLTQSQSQKFLYFKKIRQDHDASFNRMKMLKTKNYKTYKPLSTDILFTSIVLPTLAYLYITKN